MYCPPVSDRPAKYTPVHFAVNPARAKVAPSVVTFLPLPGVAHAGPAGDGDLRAAGGEARPHATVGGLRGGLRLPAGHERGEGLSRLPSRRLEPLVNPVWIAAAVEDG